MKKMKLRDVILFTMGYGFTSILIFLYITLEGLSIWMGINVVLAMIPLIAILFLYQRFIDNDKKLDLLLIVGLVFFIFFYPNSFYILTDFIHIDSIDFYSTQMYQGTTYVSNIAPYLMLFHIITSAIVGAFAGIQSLLYLEKMFELKFGKTTINTLLPISVLLLSSVGIYIGRFLRFFSWDVLKPFALLREFFGSIDLFAIGFILSFTLIEAIIYYGYKYLVIKLPNVD